MEKRANKDVRWQQRFENFQKAFAELGEAVSLAKERDLSRLETQGVIQGFEYTHELAWNVLKDYLEFFGHPRLMGSRDSTREAFARGLIDDGEIWMEMIESRNLTSHAYDHNTAKIIYDNIIDEYYPALSGFNATFLKLSNDK